MTPLKRWLFSEGGLWFLVAAGWFALWLFAQNGPSESSSAYMLPASGAFLIFGIVQRRRANSSRR